jgi:hypothetical protein
MGEAQVLDGIKRGFVNVIESTAAVFGLAAVDAEVGLFVAKQSGKELIDIKRHVHILVLRCKISTFSRNYYNFVSHFPVIYVNN